MASGTRRLGFTLLTASWVCLIASFGTAPTARADCALLQSTVKALPSLDGSVDRAFASPGETVTIFSDSACKSKPIEPHFDPIAANNEVTIIFKPPTGVTPPAVPTVLASAVLDCGDERCFALEFEIPDTTGLAGAFQLTGPARIEVHNNNAGGALVAVIEDTYERAFGCNNQNRILNLFEKFTILPSPNLYIESASTTLNAAVDGTGSLLIPWDFSPILPVNELAVPPDSVGGTGSVRLLNIQADLPNALSGGNGLTAPDDAFIRPTRFGRYVRAFSVTGRTIPPLLKVAASESLLVGSVEYGDTIVGSVDFPRAVLRIAQSRPHPVNPSPATLRIFALDGDEGEPGLTLQAGVGPVLLTGVTLGAGAAAPLNSVGQSQNIAVVARDERLEDQFGITEVSGDGDNDDRVVSFIDLESDTEINTAMPVLERDAKAIIANSGSTVAFLESEIHSGRTDLNGDGDFSDGILRVWSADGSAFGCGGTPCEVTAGTDIGVNPIQLIKGDGVPQPLQVSGGFVFFGRPEFGAIDAVTTRVSLTSVGGQTVGGSGNPTVSLNGQWVGFTSDDPNVVAGTTLPNPQQVYLTDTFGAPGANTLISATSFGGLTGGNGASDNISLNSDGTIAVWDSFATNLIGSDTNGQRDVFFREANLFVQGRASENAGVGGNGPSSNPHMAANSSIGVYQSEASNLVAGDTNGASDIFWTDSFLVSERVSLTDDDLEANGASRNPAVSGAGSLIVFDSDATDLVTGDTAGNKDVFLRDRNAATTTRVSVGYAGAEANGDSSNPDIDDVLGQYVVFQSTATNLLAPGTSLPQPSQCYVYDTLKSHTVLVSANLSGVGANAPCLNPSLDPSGQVVTFASMATNLDPLASTSSMRIYIFNRVLGTVFAAAADAATNGPTAGPTGTRSEIGFTNQIILVFDSSASDYGIVDTNGVSDVYGQIIPGGTPDYNSDTDNGDTVLFVYNASTGALANTGVAIGPANPAGDVAVAAGRAAIAPAPGFSQGVIYDSALGLRSMSTSFGAFKVSISDSAYCSVDVFSGTLHVGDLLPPTANPNGQDTFIPMALGASTVVQAVGNRCIVRDSSGILRIVENIGAQGAHNVVNTLQSVRDFQAGDEGVAFRTCEADLLPVPSDLNGDTDTDDCVMRFWDYSTGLNTLVENARHVAIPCTFPGCDPFFEPYRTGPGILSFVTSEPQEVDLGGTGASGDTCLPTSPAGICDKTGDEDGDDVAIEILSLQSGRAQVFPVDMKNPPMSTPFPKVVAGGADNVMVVQLPAALLGTEFSTLPPEHLVTVIVGDPDGDGVFESDGNLDPDTTVVDPCQEIVDSGVDLDGDGMAGPCDLSLGSLLPNDDPNPATAPAPAQLPGGNLCDLNKSAQITRTEVDQIWEDRGTLIAQPADHIFPLDGIPDARDDRDKDADGQVTAVDFRLCLGACETQAGGCPLVEASVPGFGWTVGSGGCGLLGIESLIVLLPWAWRRRRVLRRAS